MIPQSSWTLNHPQEPNIHFLLHLRLMASDWSAEANSDPTQGKISSNSRTFCLLISSDDRLNDVTGKQRQHIGFGQYYGHDD